MGSMPLNLKKSMTSSQDSSLLPSLTRCKHGMWSYPQPHYQGMFSRQCLSVSVYLWLMVHSTGQRAIAQPLKDEINHLAKFWGFANWAFQDDMWTRIRFIAQQLWQLFQHHQQERNTSSAIAQNFHPLAMVEIAFIFTRVLTRLNNWNRQMSMAKLDHLFA